ncbi:hypothetical protein SacglDRAFT_04290 [Saccharomonospora glauca K62]|uniref:Uncharacterized protein n=1 Tax=Saccharomonospora glauca K62 TaxID=928724 RepID=I1D844_9PSEU|nr:hypothetical protein SacglDRAFT_04290 [Saccharomonospora glauca K62]
MVLKDPLKLEKLAAQTWCERGETLLMRIGPRWGHVAFDVAGRRGAPHEDGGRISPRSVGVPEWPLPTEAVAAGNYHGDEWVHDPSIWAWVHAPNPTATAVGCADGLAAGGADAWLVLSNRRLAVVMAASAARETEPEDEQQSSGGWLSRAKSIAKGAQSLVRSEEESLLTLWEAPSTVIHHFGALPMGRDVEPAWFGQVAFRDTSTLLIRMDNKVAAESVVSAGSALTSA